MTFSEPKISIIFPSYNDEDMIADNLKSIENLKNSPEIEIVIIDNNSIDCSKDMIKSFRSLDINLIELDYNSGFAKACNIGALNAKGDYIFITNQDMIFPSDFFELLLPLFNKLEKKGTAIICPLSVFKDGKSINYFGAKIHFLGFSYTPTMYERLPNKIKTFRTLKVAGGCMFLRKETFLRLRGFDTYFFMYHEDTDFSLKALRNNISVYTTNLTKIYHQKHDFSLSDFTYYYIERNRFICVAKNLENLKRIIPQAIIAELVLLLQAVIIKKIKTRIKVYKFLIQNYKTIKNIRNLKGNSRVPKVKQYQLSRNLDTILLGEVGKNNKILKFFLKFLNIF
ncbi:MAG: glycosyltransferase family 2 protein, partial [Candidatus Lokiarchaeota archaeon]|nr:glycosyltransferase family 2 protein [Candidatus Lokiarchaeota archaeon]